MFHLKSPRLCQGSLRHETIGAVNKNGICQHFYRSKTLVSDAVTRVSRGHYRLTLGITRALFSGKRSVYNAYL